MHGQKYIIKRSITETTDIELADETYDELDEAVEQMLNEAQRRARLNGRKRILPRDI